MKLCVLYEATDSPWGGSNQFLRALIKELTQLGHQVMQNPNQTTEIVLINAHNLGPGIYLWPSLVAQLKHTSQMTKWGHVLPVSLWSLLPRRGPILIHRLDGLPELYRGFRTKADRIQLTINSLTDYTVFQSRYCKESFAQYGIHPHYSCVIYNGVDPDIFYPCQNPKLSPNSVLKLVAISWSPNPRKGFSLLAQISQLPEVEVRFIGQWPSSIPSANVQLMGTQSSYHVAEMIRTSDAMIHPASNEPCSNAILEALACGLPILFRDSGGNRELAGEYGTPISNDLRSDIAQLRSRYKEFRSKILENRHRFLISQAVKGYLEAFQQALDLCKK